ncbi:MAG TPA: ABC transporter substrate-binding protein [Acidimicrobiales bacterium]|nr:ABC transporter substrate-binding protein [Acidimicrobiales bacterium]
MRRILWVGLLAVVVLGPMARSRLGGDGGDGGGTLRIGVGPLGTLDPAQARSSEQALVADQLFDSLTAYDPRTLEPVPSLATRWETTPDQRRWTFHLRPGALFADGRTISATDVKYSFERVARRGSGSPGAELLQPVAGYGPFRNGAPDLAGVTAPSSDVVEIALEEPVAVLASVLASPLLSVVPRDAVEAAPPAAPFAEAPVGSGPFRVVSDRDGVLELRRSPRSSAGVRVVDIVRYADVRTAYTDFTRGRLDWARVPPDEVEDAARRYGDDAFRPYVAEVFYGFNLKSPKLADVRFRQAIVAGIDRRALVAAVYHGTAEPATGVVLDGVPGHESGGCRPCDYDPERAKALLAAAFPPASGPPPEVSLDFDADATQEAMARAVQASLADVGIRVALRATPAEEYDRHVLSGDQEVFRLGWIAAYPSPDAVLWPLFRSDSGNNLFGFADTHVDELLAAARSEGDRVRRAGLYREAEEAIMGDVPVIPVAQIQFQSVVSRRVRDLVVTSMGTFDASAVRLAGR